MYRWKAYNYRDIEQTFLLLGHTVDNIEQELGSYDVSPEFERDRGEDPGNALRYGLYGELFPADIECL